MEQLINHFFAKQKEARGKSPYLTLSQAACHLVQETLHRHSKERGFSLYFLFQENTSSSKTAFFFSGSGLKKRAVNQADYPLFFHRARRTGGYFFLGGEQELREANALLGEAAFREVKGFGMPPEGRKENSFCFLIAKKKPAELHLEERAKKLLGLGAQLMETRLAALRSEAQRKLLERVLEHSGRLMDCLGGEERGKAGLRWVAEEMGAARLSLLLRQPAAKGGGLRLAAAVGIPAAALRALQTAQGGVVEESAFLRAADRLGAPLQVVDLENQTEQKQWGRNKRLRYKKSSLLIAPLRGRGKDGAQSKTKPAATPTNALGFLCCSEKQEGQFFSQNEMAAAAAFSRLLSSALEQTSNPSPKSSPSRPPKTKA